MKALSSQLDEVVAGMTDRQAATPKLRFADTAARSVYFSVVWTKRQLLQSVFFYTPWAVDSHHYNNNIIWRNIRVLRLRRHKLPGTRVRNVSLSNDGSIIPLYIYGRTEVRNFVISSRKA